MPWFRPERAERAVPKGGCDKKFYLLEPEVPSFFLDQLLQRQIFAFRILHCLKIRLNCRRDCFDPACNPQAPVPNISAQFLPYGVWFGDGPPFLTDARTPTDRAHVSKQVLFLSLQVDGGRGKDQLQSPGRQLLILTRTLLHLGEISFSTPGPGPSTALTQLFCLLPALEVRRMLEEKGQSKASGRKRTFFCTWVGFDHRG